MSLMNCTECKKEISTEASVCPGCGTPAPKVAVKKSEKFDVRTLILPALVIIGFIYWQMTKSSESPSTPQVTKSENAQVANVTPPKPVFPLTIEQFEDKFNDVARRKGIDIIKSEKVDNDSVILIFDDTEFQKSAKAFRDLKLLKGKATMRAHLAVSLSGNNIKQIALTGDRADPMNLFGFIILMDAVVTTLNPSLPGLQVGELVEHMGLKRGDSDPTIGKPTTTSDQEATYYCNSMPSTTATTIGCLIEPKP